MQTRIDPLLKQMEIGKENLMIIMLFNDFCDPCVNQILGLTERLDSLEFGGKKILLVVKDGNYDKKSFNTLKSYEVHRHQIESAGLNANTNSLVIYKENGHLSNYWILDNSTIPGLMDYFK